MTPEERQQVVEQRRALGYPLHAPPHPNRDEGRYLITAANFEHALIMASPQRLTEFEARLLDALAGIEATVYAWVILPNHYHVLLAVLTLNQISDALQELHGKTSREWNLADGRTGQRKVWYKFSDRWIRNDRHFYRALNYIHANPVKHGYVASPYDWPWSSLERYVEHQGREWLQETWKKYPPDRFGRGWDDAPSLNCPPLDSDGFSRPTSNG
ncbi:MAG: hypothetical protein NZ528_09125 [Caldilineales bacterium]|nr:hypothetical protein [Caldilineales bacterium]MDW8319019.1 transposase [Anaerolineae bacterium]